MRIPRLAYCTAALSVSPHDAVLAGSVDRIVGIPAERGNRGVVDDRTTVSGQHGRDLVLHREPHAGEVRADDSVPCSFRRFGEGTGATHRARVVEGAVQAPIGPHDALDHCPDVVLARDIGAHEERIAAVALDLADRLLALCLTTCGNGDLRPFAGERQRRRPADPELAPVTSATFPSNSPGIAQPPPSSVSR
jgi:hypothetical protein